MVLATVVLLLHLAWAGSDVRPGETTSIATSTTATTDTEPQPDDRPARTVAASSDSPTLTAVSLDPESQNSQSLSAIRVPSVQAATPSKVISVEDLHSRRNWLILSIAQHSLAAFDAYSTRQAVSAGAREADPLMRPFARSPAIYAAIQGSPVILDYAAHQMQRSSNNFLRHTWWLPQSASSGLFLLSGVHNLRIANRP